MKISSKNRIGARDAPAPMETAGQAITLRSSPDAGGAVLTRQQIADYMENLRARGAVENSVKKYNRDLMVFYEFLPEKKRVTRTTLAEWRAALLSKGYAPRTVNAAISAVYGFLAWLGMREYQLVGQLPIQGDAQPELTRNEYLRLLSAARAAGKERAYLMVKVFGCMGLAVQELPQLTVEAVRDGRLAVSSHGAPRQIHLPAALHGELMDYIRRAGIASGPVFVTRNGKRISRTSVTSTIQALAKDAHVAPEKCNPRCLKKLCLSTVAGIEASVRLLVEQAYDQMLEQEQFTIGWEEGMP